MTIWEIEIDDSKQTLKFSICKLNLRVLRFFTKRNVALIDEKEFATDLIARIQR